MNALTAFSGPSVTVGVTGEVVSFDPLTGHILVNTAELFGGVTINLTTTGSDGAITSRYKLLLSMDAVETPVDPTVPVDPTPVDPAPVNPTPVDPAPVDPTPVDPVPVDPTPVDPKPVDPAPVDPLPPAGSPVAAGTLDPLVFAQETGVQTVSAAALFSGSGLVFSLENAPAGVTIDESIGLVQITTAAALPATSVTVVARNAAGQARQSFTISVRARITTFDRPEALGDLRFLSDGAAPSWTQGTGFARLVPALGTRVYGDWKLARGDGRYRALVRWTAPNQSIADTPLLFGGRIARADGKYAGIRLEAVQAAAGQRVDLRQHGGSIEGTSPVTSTPVAWTWSVWHWVELESDGAEVRGRIYAEGEAAPAWQVRGATAHRDGVFGPGALALAGQSPTVDIKRLEFHPLPTQNPVEPAAPQGGDWTLEQFTERT